MEAMGSTNRRWTAGAILSLAFAVAAVQAESVTYGFGNSPSNVLEADLGNESRIRGVVDRAEKDFVLGVLIPIHAASAGGGRCGVVQVEGGVEEMEAILFALDCINSIQNLLPNLTLGYDIRDTCYSENIALDEALDLIVIGTERQFTTCDVEVAGTVNSSANVPTFGIVGPTASGVSIHVAGLSRLFETPQVSFASSSSLLNNRDKYGYFYRTIPPDNLQAKAMIALLMSNKWTHISIIFSRNIYGIAGRDEIVLLADENGICIDLNEGIDDDYEEGDFNALASLINNSTASVVVAFAILPDMEKLLSKVSPLQFFSQLTWIASDAWAGSSSVLSYFDNRTTGGLFGVSPTAQHVETFHTYFNQLTIQDNKRNPWFAEYFAAKMKCDVSTSCKLNESVAEVSQRNGIPRAIDAVFSLAFALNNFLIENCDNPLVWHRENMTCNGQKRTLNGTNLLEHLANLSFVSPTGSQIEFDHLGNIVNTSYEIINYQISKGNETGAIVDIGIWKANGTTLEDESLGVLIFFDSAEQQFGLDNDGQSIAAPVISECGRCKPGYYHKPVISSCCGICEPCLGQAYSDQNQAPSCKNCSDFGELWGNNPLQGSNSCVLISETFLDFGDPYSIVITIIASLGLVAVVFVVIIFGLNWNTPVVKSSSREQMLLLLIGVSLSFALAFIYVAPPMLGICIIQRVGLWFCYSLMFGALMIKCIRITRIFLNKSSMKRLKFAETQYQILFTALAILGQMVLVIASVAYAPPSIQREIRLNRNNNEFPEVVVTCMGDSLPFILLSVVYESILIAVVTILGVVSFKYPANFNEAKHISFCTFALLIIWMGFIPSYFATQQVEEYQKAVLSMAIVMSAVAVLACVFGPRVFIIIFRAERNTKQFSRTKQAEQVSTVQGEPTDFSTMQKKHPPNGTDINDSVEAYSSELQSQSEIPGSSEASELTYDAK